MAAEQVYRVADVKIGGPIFPSADPTNISTSFFWAFVIVLWSHLIQSKIQKENNVEIIYTIFQYFSSLN